MKSIDYFFISITFYLHRGRKRVAIVQVVLNSLICCNEGLITLKETLVEAAPIKSSVYTPLILHDVRATFYT